MTREERIEAALGTVGKATEGPWELCGVGDKIKHLCPAKDNTSLLTIALEYNDDYDEPTSFGAVYSRDDAILMRAAPDLRDEVIALRKQVERQKWISVKERLPESGKYVNAFFSRTIPISKIMLIPEVYSTVIRAFYAAPKSIETSEEEDFGEYDEATDQYYLPEGWYECNEEEETHYFVHEEITHWQPLPEPPQIESEEAVEG